MPLEFRRMGIKSLLSKATWQTFVSLVTPRRPVHSSKLTTMVRTQESTATMEQEWLPDPTSALPAETHRPKASESLKLTQHLPREPDGSHQACLTATSHYSGSR